MAKVNKNPNNAKNEVTLFNQERVELMKRINFDADMISLTDLWKEAGSDNQKTPAKWQESEPTQRFIKAVSRILNIGISDIIKSKRGKGGGTYAHKQIAIEYAQYLDERLAVLVNEIFFQRIEEEKNPDLIVDRAITTYKKRGHTDDWISKRLRGKSKRNEFTATLAAHGVKHDGFKNCTNAIYTPLFGGSTDVIRARKNLPDGAIIRDNLTDFELDAVYFAECMAQHVIKERNVRGNGNCEVVCRKSSHEVANAITGLRKNVEYAYI